MQSDTNGAHTRINNNREMHIYCMHEHALTHILHIHYGLPKYKGLCFYAAHMHICPQGENAVAAMHLVL